MIFSGDSLPTDINFLDLTLFKPTPTYVKIHGDVTAVSTGVEEAATAKQPSAVTFTQRGSFIRLSLWQAQTSGSSVEFHFKTLEPHALLVGDNTSK